MSSQRSGGPPPASIYRVLRCSESLPMGLDLSRPDADTAFL